MWGTTISAGELLVATVTGLGFVASWVGFRVTVLVRMTRIEEDLRTAFGPNGRIQRIEDIQMDQGGHIQRIVGRLETVDVVARKVGSL
jgi:hypothetical protein